MKLDEVLTARRTMDFAACNLPNDIFLLAKEEYFYKLKQYQDEYKENPEQLKLFYEKETERTALLAVINNTGSDDESKTDNAEIRVGLTGQRGKSPSVR